MSWNIPAQSGAGAERIQTKKRYGVIPYLFHYYLLYVSSAGLLFFDGFKRNFEQALEFFLLVRRHIFQQVFLGVTRTLRQYAQEFFPLRHGD